MKYDVFISYSRKDSTIVNSFKDKLVAAGYKIWMDKDGIESGDEFKRKIASAIRESKVFIFFSSATSNESEWTVKEVNYAIKKKIQIIPIKLDKADYNESVDFDLCGVDFIQCNGSKDIHDTVGKLLRSLKNRIGDGSLEQVVEREDGAETGGDDVNPSNNFWDFFASSTFKVSFRYFCSIVIVVSVGVGFWSSFMVDSVPPELEYAPIKNYSEQVEDKYSQSDKPAPDEVLGHRPANSPGESDSNGVTPESRTVEEYSPCPTCYGSGIKYEFDVFNNMYMALPCPDCSGSGILPDKQFKEQEISVNKSFINGREYVDLGLPSGIKWATCNIGATKPEGYGGYYAWGETEEKDCYDWSTYKWCNGSKGSITKYCTDSSYGTVDNKTVLEPQDDVAHVRWGGRWRMPTIEEQKELLDNCTCTWTTQNGVKGYKVTSKTNGNSIFLPAAGCHNGAGVNLEGVLGSYWSASLDGDSSGFAYCLDLSSDNCGMDSCGRSYGRSVRPVSE